MINKCLLFASLLAGTSLFAQNKAAKLPPPGESNINFAKVVGWKDGQMPKAPAGFTVTKYAEGFQSPRWMYVLPNGDVLVAETNAKYPVLVQAGMVV